MKEIIKLYEKMDRVIEFDNNRQIGELIFATEFTQTGEVCYIGQSGKIAVGYDSIGQ